MEIVMRLIAIASAAGPQRDGGELQLLSTHREVRTSTQATLENLFTQYTTRTGQLREITGSMSDLPTIFTTPTTTTMVSGLTYAIPLCGPYLSVDLNQRIDAFLNRSFRYSFSKHIFEIQTFQIQPCTISLLKYRPVITVFFTFSLLEGHSTKLYGNRQ